MELNMSPQERLGVDLRVNEHNIINNAANGRAAKQSLGKDDFLTLLIAQLQHQDPSNPMENTDFIAQMAQFSTLEQITNVSAGFDKLAGKLNNSEASSMLGKTVEVVLGETIVTGMVESVTRGEMPEVMVNGGMYALGNIKKIWSE